MTLSAATANVDKALRGTKLAHAIQIPADAADVVAYQEVERARHVKAVAALPGFSCYLPAGRKRSWRNACPIAWRTDDFVRAASGVEQIGKGIANVQPNRVATWVILAASDGTTIAAISTHTVSGVWKNLKRRFAQWFGRNRRQESDHEIAALADLTRRLAKRADVVIVAGDLNRPERIRPDLIGCDQIVYATRPTHGRHWFDLIGLIGAKGSGAHRIATPSDHDALACTVTPVGTKPAPQPRPKEPTVATIDGIDISHWQNGRMDFAKARKAGVKFVCHKATESTTYVDGYHDRRRREVDAAGGIAFGSYHFARPSRSSGARQAEFFLKHAAVGPGRMRPVLDLEDRGGLSQSALTRWVEDWVRVVQKAAGEPPIIYTNFNLDQHFDCMRWAARYSNAMSLPHAAHPWATWSIWQFSNGVYGKPRSVPGIGHCDINTFNSGIDIDVLTLGSKPKPKPNARPQEDDMALSENDLDRIEKRIEKVVSRYVGDVIPNPNPPEKRKDPKNDFVAVKTVLGWWAEKNAPEES